MSCHLLTRPQALRPVMLSVAQTVRVCVGTTFFLGVFGLLRQGVLCIPYIGKKDNMWLSVVFLLQDRPPAIAEASGLVLSVVLHQYVAWLRLLPCGLSGSLYDQGCY